LVKDLQLQPLDDDFYFGLLHGNLAFKYGTYDTISTELILKSQFKPGETLILRNVELTIVDIEGWGALLKKPFELAANKWLDKF
jgi:hypothetical protein